MSKRVGVVWDERLAEYDFGPGHPLTPIRVQLAMRLAADFDLLVQPNVQLLSPVDPISMDDLLRVHDGQYVAAVVRASETGFEIGVGDRAWGFGTADVPVFPGMHQASARVAGATLAATQAVHAGSVEHAVNLAGGLHHAMPAAASGFCVYNDVAASITWLLDQGVERIAYVDLDVHHGDGVQAMFWDDPRVLTMSIHESPASLFPGTGWPSEIGGAAALGTAVNIALPAGTGDQGWLRAFHAVVPQLLEAFDPQVVISQHGVDAHADDPLANLNLSIDGQRMSYEAMHRWAHRYAAGRWVAVGGGGYEWLDVVPRAWTHLIAELGGHPIDPGAELPEAFRAYVEVTHGRSAPVRMTDGRTPWPKSFEEGFNPNDEVDQAISLTRELIFPIWGLALESDNWL